MTNNVQTLATPEYEESVCWTMQSVGMRHVQYMNKGLCVQVLWESRHRSCLVDAEQYLLTCSRYIEMNPVAVNMVQYQAEYKWSSFRSNAFGEPDSLVKLYDLYKRPGATDELRCRAYAALFDKVIDPADVKLIHNAVMCSIPTNRLKRD